MRKENFGDNGMTIVILLPMLVLTRLAAGEAWWIFVLPVFLLGGILGWKKRKLAAFRTGFLAGFGVWAGAHLYFHFSLDGVLWQKAGWLTSAGLVLLSGLIGGVLCGLALFSGKSLVAGRKSAEQI